MKRNYVVIFFSWASMTAAAEPFLVRGPDNLEEVMTDVVQASGLQDEIQFIAESSYDAENAFCSRRQGFVPLTKKIDPFQFPYCFMRTTHPIALEGIGVYVERSNPIAKLSLSQLNLIYSCKIKDWAELTGGQKTGAIKVFRRQSTDRSTKALQNLLYMDTFGGCAQLISEDSDAITAMQNPNAIIYGNFLSTPQSKIRSLALSKDENGAAYNPSLSTIRSKLYPLVNVFFIYKKMTEGEPSDYKFNPAEAKLIENILNRSFMDPIVKKHGFITFE